MVVRSPKWAGKGIEMRLWLRETGCTARPRCEGRELRELPLPFEMDMRHLRFGIEIETTKRTR